MKSGIYLILCLDNNKRYVGSAVDIKSRWRVHRSCLNNEKHHSKHFQRCWNKYPHENFLFSILELCEIDVLIQREQHYIDVLCPELNSVKTAGSNLGLKWSEESKRNASISQKEASKTRRNPLKGTKGMVSEETRAKLSSALKGKIFPKGRKFTDEHKKKLSDAKKGKTTWNKGKQLTDEHKQKLSLAKLGKKLPVRTKEWCENLSIGRKAAWERRKDNGILE